MPCTFRGKLRGKTGFREAYGIGPDVSDYNVTIAEGSAAEIDVSKL
jgi:hypothetical protein